MKSEFFELLDTEEQEPTFKGQVYTDDHPTYQECSSCGSRHFFLLADHCWTGVVCIACGAGGCIHDG